MSIAIRPYVPADLAACRLLWAELTIRHRQLYDDPTIGGADPGRYFDETYVKDPRLRGPWVAVSDEAVVGLTGLYLHGDAADIEPVVVASTHRRLGIGKRLVRRVIEEARRLGVRWLNVKPVARNEEAIRFFHACGLAKLGDVELFQDLDPASTRRWRPGPRIHGVDFDL